MSVCTVSAKKCEVGNELRCGSTLLILNHSSKAVGTGVAGKKNWDPFQGVAAHSSGAPCAGDPVGFNCLCVAATAAQKPMKISED